MIISLMNENNMPFDCAMIIGSGAVEHAWDPIISFFQFIYENVGSPPCGALNPDDVNYILAGYIYRLEFVYLHGSSTADQQKSLNQYETIKRGIAENLKQADGGLKIRARDSVIETMKTFIPRGHRCRMMTTNWDKCVENAIHQYALCQKGNFDKMLYLHGNYDDPQTLYLPSEKIDEPYRTETEKNRLNQIHSKIFELVGDARRIILFGISLSVLDVELAQTLYSASMRDNVKEIFIIDVNPDPVAKRLSILFNNNPRIEIVGFRPDDLDCEINY